MESNNSLNMNSETNQDQLSLIEKSEVSEMIQSKPQPKSRMAWLNQPQTQSLIGIGLILLIVGGVLFIKSTSGQIAIENSEITAPTMNLTATTSSALNQLYVNEGDNVLANTPLARVGTDVISAPVSGIVITLNKNLGKTLNPGEVVATMIDPTQLQVVGQIDETKGLDKIKVGQPVSFTVDTFGSKEFTGFVEQISPTSDETSISFSISDKRPVKKFDIKVRYNTAEHPEFKNGMSAKITVYQG